MPHCTVCMHYQESEGLCKSCQAVANEPAPAKPLHLTWEDCERRYPRICRALQWVLIGSPGEAACCLRDYRDGQRYGGEAVSHSGLSPAHRVRMACGAYVRAVVRRQRGTI